MLITRNTDCATGHQMSVILKFGNKIAEGGHPKGQSSDLGH